MEELQVQKVGMVGMMAALAGHGGLMSMGMGGYVHGHMVAWVYEVGLIQDINLYVWVQGGGMHIGFPGYSWVQHGTAFSILHAILIIG